MKLFSLNLREAAESMPTRMLGKTKQKVSILGLGGQGSLETQGNRENNIEIIRRAYELGITYADTAPNYGPSESIYGEALQGIRPKIFLATKTEPRDRDGVLRLLEKSLKTLKTDFVDLLQIHHLATMEEVDEVTADDGALQALLEAKEQGMIKHLGISGHEDPKVLVEAMRRHPFDVVLCAVNAADKHADPPFIETVLPEAKRRRMGIVGMKVFAQGHIFHEKGIKTKWEPLSYALSQSVSTVIVGCDNVQQLEENIAIAKSFRGLSAQELKEIEKKTKPYVRQAQFFRKKYGGYDSIEKLDTPLFS